MKRKINPETLQECFSDYRYEPIFSLRSTKVHFWGNLPASWTVFPKMRSKGLGRYWHRLQSAAFQALSLWLRLHFSNPHDRFWSGLSVKSPVLDPIQWTKLNGSQGKFGWWLPHSLIFPAVHFPRGGPGERREGVAVHEVGVTAVLGPQRRCRLRLWRSAHSLVVLRAESRPLLPISLCQLSSRNCWVVFLAYSEYIGTGSPGSAHPQRRALFSSGWDVPWQRWYLCIEPGCRWRSNRFASPRSCSLSPPRRFLF